MSNADLSAMPNQVNGGDIFGGLTKREMFCLHHGVADTGDNELDEIITKGNHLKAATSALAGILACPDASMSYAARDAATLANELFDELLKKQNSLMVKYAEAGYKACVDALFDAASVEVNNGGKELNDVLFKLDAYSSILAPSVYAAKLKSGDLKI